MCKLSVSCFCLQSCIGAMDGRPPLRVDVHTHILPESWPDLKARYGYGGWVRMDRTGCGPKRARMFKDDGVYFKLCVRARLREVHPKGGPPVPTPGRRMDRVDDTVPCTCASTRLLHSPSTCTLHFCSFTQALPSATWATICGAWTVVARI